MPASPFDSKPDDAAFAALRQAAINAGPESNAAKALARYRELINQGFAAQVSRQDDRWLIDYSETTFYRASFKCDPLDKPVRNIYRIA